MLNPSDRTPFHVHVPGDTARPQDIVPIYRFHTLDNLFCPMSGCWCHTDQQRIAPLLDQINEGVLTLREAADFAEGKLVY